jgi:hypothetical protein
VRGGGTVLSGVLAGRAALFGVLARVGALGLELIERLPPAVGLRAAPVARARATAGAGTAADRGRVCAGARFSPVVG